MSSWNSTVGMMTPLKLLLVEDSEDDAALVIRELARADYDVDATRVETEQDLRRALMEWRWDLAIADYRMPTFSGALALEIIRAHDADLPFIFVSGTIGEETAVAAMRTGANDYIMKGNLARLAPAAQRELREAAGRRERTRASERLVHLAYHDPLTDLPNRALLHDRVQQAILVAQREQRVLPLLLLDLDGFKEINDALGHFAGDRVLQQVSSQLRALLRESDTIARLGGDEFALLLPTADLDGAVQTAQRILHDLSQPFVVDDRPLVVHGSIGIAAFPKHACDSEELLQKADVAMYLAKNDRSGYAVYAADRDRHTEQRLALRMALSRGINTKQFFLEYQPIVHMQTGTVTAIEALLRWNHPEQGQLQPKDFIQIAEQMHLITLLTIFSIDRGLTEWSDALTMMPLTIAVNLSPHSLHDAMLPRRVRQLLAARGAAPSSLALEITENVIMSNPDESIRCLTELHDMGVRLVIDDFGTGYSSLSYLRRLPVDELKIDQSFVIGLANGEDEALVRSIIDLAHNLRLSVTAEGVETDAVHNRLLALGCDAVQGHFVRRPGPAAEIMEWMAANQSMSRVSGLT